MIYRSWVILTESDRAPGFPSPSNGCCVLHLLLHSGAVLPCPLMAVVAGRGQSRTHGNRTISNC